MPFDDLARAPASSPVGAEEADVVWGPFPLRRARLLIGIACLGFAVLVGFIGTLRDSITCARRGPLAGQCEWRGGARGNSQKSFALSSVLDVSVKYSESHRRKQTVKRGEVVVSTTAGEIHMKRETPEGAEANVETLRRFLHTSEIETVQVVTQREWWAIFFVAAVGLFGIGTLYSVIAGRRRFRCTWNGFTQELSVQREWPFGIITSEPVNLTLTKPAAVEIDWGRTEDFFSSSRSPGAPGGRLRVRLADGKSLTLDDKLWVGYGVHVRAAEKLRTLLGCAPRTPEDRAHIEAEELAARPVPSPHWTSPGGKVAAAWLGVCTGSLIGLAISGTIAVAFRFQKLSDDAGGIWFFGGVFGGAALGVWLVFRLSQNADLR